MARTIFHTELTTGNHTIILDFDYETETHNINVFDDCGMVEMFPVNDNIAKEMLWAVAKKYRKAGDGIAVNY